MTPSGDYYNLGNLGTYNTTLASTATIRWVGANTNPPPGVYRFEPKPESPAPAPSEPEDPEDEVAWLRRRVAEITDLVAAA